MKLVTLNTSLREQNHHQFNKADDAPQKNIKLLALLKKSRILKIRIVHTLEAGYNILTFKELFEKNVRGKLIRGNIINWYRFDSLN